MSYQPYRGAFGDRNQITGVAKGLIRSMPAATLIKGRNNEQNLFRTSQYGRMDLIRGREFEQSILNEGVREPVLIVLEFTDRDVERVLYQKMSELGHSDPYTYPIETVVEVLNKHYGSIPMDFFIYEGNHRTRIAGKHNLDIPAEIRFFGNTNQLIPYSKHHEYVLQRLMPRRSTLKEELEDEGVIGIKRLTSRDVFGDRRNPKNAWDNKSRLGSKVQSIMFKKRYWTLNRAKNWLRDEGFTGLIVDETDNNYRFRQEEPSKFKDGSFRTIKLKPSIQAVVGIPLKSNPARKTIQFEQVFVSSLFGARDWSKMPIQHSDATYQYFQCDIRDGRFELYSINQDYMPCPELAIFGKLEHFLDIPKSERADKNENSVVAIRKNIAWWNNHVGMILFNEQPHIIEPLFGVERFHRFYFSNGVLYKETIVYMDGEVSESNIGEPVWDSSDYWDTPVNVLFLEETLKPQTVYIGINRRYIQSLLSRSE